MIFNCGPTWDEWKRRRGEWHDFFAIWPRVVAVINGERQCAWMQTIQRRSTHSWDYSGGRWQHEYRLPQSGESGDSGSSQ